MTSIGQAADLLKVSPHTLRYYEKIGLIAPVSKTSGGSRQYQERDIERIKFIKRAQRMHFSLEEIRALIDLDKAAIIEKPQAQRLVKDKLKEIEESLIDLNRLKKDLNQMLSACLSSSENEDCPIIEGLKQTESQQMK
jgi:DNA-binding transcriptional MerR regulator